VESVTLARLKLVDFLMGCDRRSPAGARVPGVTHQLLIHRDQLVTRLSTTVSAHTIDCIKTVTGGKTKKRDVVDTIVI
jgi:hypothetical protein